MSATDLYMLDICISLRLLVDAALAQPDPAPAAQVSDLREPVAQTEPVRKKPRTRDDLQADARGEGGL